MSKFELPMDLSGALTSNKVVNEKHIVAADTTALFVTLKGNYFKDSLVVRDSQGQVLSYINDFSEYVIDQEMTRMAGQVICSGVVIKLENPAGSYFIDYQAIGGEGSVTPELYRALLEELAVTKNKVINFNDLKIPATFKPGPHTHNLLHLSENQLLHMAFKELTKAMQGIHTTGLSGNELSRNMTNITSMIMSLRNSVNRLSTGDTVDLTQIAEFTDLVDLVNTISLSLTNITEQMARIETKVDQDHDSMITFFQELTGAYTTAESTLNVTPFTG